MQLTDASGKLLQTVTTGNASYQWNMRTFSPGLFYVKIFADNGDEHVLKIVKQ